MLAIFYTFTGIIVIIVEIYYTVENIEEIKERLAENIQNNAGCFL